MNNKFMVSLRKENAINLKILLRSWRQDELAIVLHLAITAAAAAQKKLFKRILRALFLDERIEAFIKVVLIHTGNALCLLWILT